MIFELTSFVLGVMTGGLVLACLAIPRVGRILSKCLATALFAAGVGVLIWVAVQEIHRGPLTPIVWRQIIITQPGEALGWGGGLVCGGLLALVLSFIGSSDRR